jgi:hypothetical protein
MDFVERLFGISPDGGSGAYEALLFLLPFVALGLWRLPKLLANTRNRHL